MSTKMEGRIYDGKSTERLIKSISKEFTSSSTIHDNGVNIMDSDVTTYGSYLEQQLTYIIPRVLQRKYPAMPALEIFGVSNEGSIEKVLVRRMKSFSGEHTREIENKANPPKGVISVGYDATGMKIEDFEAISNYNEIDLIRASAFNDPLDASIIAAHDNSYKRIVDKVAFLGMTDEAGNTLVEGLLNNSNVVAALSNNATASFDSNSGVQTYIDIRTLYAEMVGASGGNQELWPNTAVASPRVVSLLNTVTYGTVTSDVQNHKSIAQLMKENLGITEIRATANATGIDSGVGGTDRLCLFNRNSDCMTLHIPKPLTFSEVFKEMFKYKISSQFRIAGLAIEQNVAFGYLKGC